MDGHNYQQRQDDQEDWHLHRLWRQAKNRGFNIRIEDDHIRITPSLQWYATPARSFTWNNEGIKAAHTWINNLTGTLHQQQQTTPYQPSTYTPTQTTTASQPAAKGGKTPTIVSTVIAMVAIFIGLGIWYNNNNYNTTFENNFISHCEDNGNGASAAACGCAYNVLKANYSYSQAKYFDANTSASDTQAAFNWIANQCK